jgi:DAK2 domain fusion protein YloV
MGATIEARTFREAMARYLEALRSHRQEIDSLNVFPVPDGDTGTNMLLTQQAVVDALEAQADGMLPDLGETASRAALMGARGNSGVILSQVYRGLCQRLCRDRSVGPQDLATALEEASSQAHRAVAEPAEGTMLSVLRDAAGAAGEASAQGAGMDEVASAALRAGQAALERTPDQLPALAEAGVVDAGGKGIVLLLDAIVSSVREIPLSVEVGPLGPVGTTGELPQQSASGDGFGFEVMYLLECDDARMDRVRTLLDSLGDSLVVVGGGGLFNVHVHTGDPGAAVEVGIEAGHPRQIRIASLDERVGEACLAGEARAVRVAVAGPSSSGDGSAAEAPGVAVVAVAPGDGIADLFESLGARVVAGGPGRNPSVAELAAAVEGAGAAEVLLIPNHRNVVPAAERVAAERNGVTVISTSSVPEGLAAAAACNPADDGDRNAARAREAAANVTSVEVGSATRDAETPAGPARAGQLLGIVDGEIRVVGDEPVDVLLGALRPLVREEHEVLTVLTGEGFEDVEDLRRALGEAFPGLEIEVHRGGQPHYPLLVGLE